jgi:hypothetical protein
LRKFTNGWAGVLHPSNKQNLCLGKKSYSTLPAGDPQGEVSAEKVYKNADIDKSRILLENKGKAGVYR